MARQVTRSGLTESGQVSSPQQRPPRLDPAGGRFGRLSSSIPDPTWLTSPPGPSPCRVHMVQHGPRSGVRTFKRTGRGSKTALGRPRVVRPCTPPGLPQLPVSGCTRDSLNVYARVEQSRPSRSVDRGSAMRPNQQPVSVRSPAQRLTDGYVILVRDAASPNLPTLTECHASPPTVPVRRGICQSQLAGDPLVPPSTRSFFPFTPVEVRSVPHAVAMHSSRCIA